MQKRVIWLVEDEASIAAPLIYAPLLAAVPGQRQQQRPRAQRHHEVAHQHGWSSDPRQPAARGRAGGTLAAANLATLPQRHIHHTERC